MEKTIEYRGLRFTKTDLKLSDKRFDQTISFDGAIAHELLKDADFEYYLMPQFDLSELLQALGTTRDAKDIYLVEGRLITNNFKQKEFIGYYIFARWGLIPIQLENKEALPEQTNNHKNL